MQVIPAKKYAKRTKKQRKNSILFPYFSRLFTFCIKMQAPPHILRWGLCKTYVRLE